MFIVFVLFITLQAKELPKSALLEKYLLSAQMYEEQYKYKKAIESFEEIEALHITLPKEFFYRYAINLYHDKCYDKSREYFTEYITRTNRSAKYYKSALKYLIMLDDDEDEDKAQKKRCKALPQIIQEEEQNCKIICREKTNKKIDANLNNYNYTTYEMFNAWYPPCKKACFKKKLKPLRRELEMDCRRMEDEI